MQVSPGRFQKEQTGSFDSLFVSGSELPVVDSAKILGLTISCELGTTTLM